MPARNRPPDWTALQTALIARGPDGLTAWQLWRALNANGPRWLGAAYRLRDLLARPFGVAPIAGHGRTDAHAAPPRPGDKVQFFTVDSISDTDMTLSVEDGLLDVLTHIRVRPAAAGRLRVEIGSEVWTWNRIGRLYMIPTGPGHRMLVDGILRRLTRDMPPPCGAASARTRGASCLHVACAALSPRARHSEPEPADMSDAPKSPSILNAPLIGPLLGALKGENAPLAIVALVLVLGIVLIAAFGYPALILLVLTATFGMLGGLILLTRAR